MAWLRFFLRDLGANIGDFLFVALALGEITAVGIVYFRSFIKERRFSVLIPGGMVAGTAVFTLYLGVLSHLLKARQGIWIISVLYFLSGLLIFSRSRKKWKFKFPKVSLRNIVLLLSSLLLGLIFVIKAGNAIFGGDATTYWGLATSFANGNYPQVLPWQPQFLTVHHQGAFLFEGALHAITGVEIRQIHFVFAAFIIAAGFFLLWAFLGDKPKKVVSAMIPSLLGYITFGGFFVILPLVFGEPGHQRDLVDLPNLQDAKNTLGALVSFFDLYYLIPRTTALAVIILVFIVITGEFIGGRKKRLLAVAVLSNVILSIDESMFAAIVLPVSFWVGSQFLEAGDKGGYLKDALVSLLVFFALFWVVGNPLRDSLLTPSPEAPRFQLVELGTIREQKRINFLKSVLIYSESTPRIFWFLPDLRVILCLALFSSFLWGGLLARLFALIAVGTTTLYFLIEHTFWPANYLRFALMGYQFSGFALGVVVYRLLQAPKEKRVLRFLGIVFLGFVLPSTIASTLRVLKSLPSKDYANFYPLTPKYTILEWTRRNLPRKTRVFFIDGFLYDHGYSDLTLYGTQGFGLFIPTGSADVKMHTAEWGTEAIDVVNTLSPAAMKDLEIEYLFIKFDQLARFPEKRRLDLANPKFFDPVHKDTLGILYEVKRAYFSEGWEGEDTIRRLSTLIPNENQIFIDPNERMNYYLRSALLLELRNKPNLYSLIGRGHFNYVETFIRTKDPSLADHFDYLILGPETDPQTVCPEGKSCQKIWETLGVSAFEVR